MVMKRRCVWPECVGKCKYYCNSFEIYRTRAHYWPECLKALVERRRLSSSERSSVAIQSAVARQTRPLLLKLKLIPFSRRFLEEEQTTRGEELNP